jgi:glycosyltransferase involved in cell wall biosynthesis
MQEPLVCICVPTYNAAATVRESLESILRQSYRRIVVHISDNASTDDTLRVIAAVADERVSVYRQGTNCGAEMNFTRCIQLATGKYTAIFHADDIYEPDMVAKQVAYLESNADVGAVFTEAAMINELGAAFGVTGAVPGGSGGVVRLGFRDLLQRMLLYHSFLVTPSVMVRTQIYQDDIREWGGVAFRSASDVDVWLRLARKNIAVLDERLMRYRISNTQGSNKNRIRTERLDFFLVMEHYLNRADVRQLLTAQDFRHYGWLERHERVARAMILFGIGRAGESKELIKGVLCWDAVRAALSTRRGLVTLAGVALLLVVMPFATSNRSRAIVRAAKNISWR